MTRRVGIEGFRDSLAGLRTAEPLARGKMRTFKLDVDVRYGDASGPCPAAVMAISRTGTKFMLAELGHVLVFPQTGRVDFEETSPGVYSGCIQPGEWDIHVKVGKELGNRIGHAPSCFFTIDMPSRDSRMADLVREKRERDATPLTKRLGDLDREWSELEKFEPAVVEKTRRLLLDLAGAGTLWESVPVLERALGEKGSGEESGERGEL